MDDKTNATRYPCPQECEAWIRNHASFPLHWTPPKRPTRPKGGKEAK